MTKVELIAAVAANAGLSKKDAEKAVNGTIAAITDALKKGDKVSLVGFGNFAVSERAARAARDPQTGKAITIPAHKVPVFKPGKPLKESVQ